MPKGVEHQISLSTGLPNLSVESLMPKGVEHKSIKTKLFHCFARCRISDAERRWALKTSVAWEVQNRVSNLWCRKALSTSQFLQSINKSSVVSNLWCRKALSTVWPTCYSASHGLLCRISDAERRWAQTIYLTPPESKEVSNLWCRKALSTR